MAIPSFEPLSIVIVHSKLDRPLAITTAATASGSRVGRRSSSPCSSSFWVWISSFVASSACAAASSSFSSWFSLESEGRWANPEKKSPTGRVTLVTARCIGAMAAFVEAPSAESGPSC